MLSNLKRSLIERYYFRILLQLCYFFYSFRCLAITTVRFHFIRWRNFSHSKEKCHGSQVHQNAKPKDYPVLNLDNSLAQVDKTNSHASDNNFVSSCVQFFLLRRLLVTFKLKSVPKEITQMPQKLNSVRRQRTHQAL